VKTEGVNAGEQAEIFYGLLKRETVLENVFVTEQGDFDFDNFERTSNGRAVVRRADFMHASPHVDVEAVDNIVLITRGPTIPAISKLTPEQAAAFMVLGQAMESSAGDPTKAGTIRTEFFYDPFIAGDHAVHANRFYDIVQNLPEVNYFLMNTGSIGEGYHVKKIDVAHTMSILDSMARGGLEDWIDSPSGFKVPTAIRSVDDIMVHPERLYSTSEFDAKQKELNKIRCEAIEQVGPNLNAKVKKVFSRG
jgi:phosphoenolpyruvate carboxykinase (ATP)